MFLVCRDLSTGMDSEDEMLKHSHSVCLIVSYISLLFRPPLVSSDAFLNLYSRRLRGKKTLYIYVFGSFKLCDFFFFLKSFLPKCRLHKQTYM